MVRVKLMVGSVVPLSMPVAGSKVMAVGPAGTTAEAMVDPACQVQALLPVLMKSRVKGTLLPRES